MTPKEINELKKLHNQYLEEGKKVYALVVDLHEKCINLQKEIEEAEGDEYDPIPLIFHAGFWIDPDL